MMPSTFLVLDTNLAFRFVTQGSKGCEAEHWAELRRLAEDEAITILVPEVVQLEFEKIVRNMERDFDEQFIKIEKALSSTLKNIWNEAEGLSGAINEGFSQWKSRRLREAKGREADVWKLFRSEHVTALPYDQDIHFRTQRRILAGRYPNQDGKPMADCAIVESLIRHFEERGEGDQLLLCTENVKDFGLLTDPEKSTLHPLFQEGLPRTQIFTDLATVVTFLHEHKAVEVVAPEVLDEALKREETKEIEEAIEVEEAVQKAIEGDQPRHHPRSVMLDTDVLKLLDRICIHKAFPPRALNFNRALYGDLKRRDLAEDMRVNNSLMGDELMRRVKQSFMFNKFETGPRPYQPKPQIGESQERVDDQADKPADEAGKAGDSGKKDDPK